MTEQKEIGAIYGPITEETYIVLALEARANTAKNLFLEMKRVIRLYRQGKTEEADLGAIDRFVTYPYLPSSYGFVKHVLALFVLDVPTPCFTRFRSLYRVHLRYKNCWAFIEHHFLFPCETSSNLQCNTFLLELQILLQTDPHKARERIVSLDRECPWAVYTAGLYRFTDVTELGSREPRSLTYEEGFMYAYDIFDAMGYAPHRYLEIIHCHVHMAYNVNEVNDFCFSDFFNATIFQGEWVQHAIVTHQSATRTSAYLSFYADMTKKERVRGRCSTMVQLGQGSIHRRRV